MTGPVQVSVRNCFQAAVGQLKLISKVTALTLHPARYQLCKPMQQYDAAAHRMPDRPT